ncbi:hypothetical protein PACID_11190 [Acidipropionibacterium acidipropionici ATCC 4875]|uniref:Uncharacterized protein n=1 Tax=Acidipropionibacterium acidipropionici (strain ATCC 4875 / DSM 20272 / JCM 6432 / NBRC 12425 / NCIMB 8070 / 4) TaxID=1171373 RepID=K7RVF6_ACIA4|nr:hypothetical protein PACID_11190 [Acidipropionibacterium acidipropionici ATCC 4875]
MDMHRRPPLEAQVPHRTRRCEDASAGIRTHGHPTHRGHRSAGPTSPLPGPGPSAVIDVVVADGP